MVAGTPTEWFDGLPSCFTLEAATFFQERERWESFQAFVLDALLREPRVVEALAAKAPLPAVSKHAEISLAEAIYCRQVDNYLTYISEVLRSLCLRRPEMMHSAEKVAVADVLAHKRMSDLVSWLVERKVNNLSYLGLQDLHEELGRRWGFGLGSDEDVAGAVRIIEIRNLLVHSRGIVNPRFLSRVPDSGYSLGDPVCLSLKETTQAGSHLTGMVCETDQNLASKFGLDRPRRKEDIRDACLQIHEDWGGPFGGYPAIPDHWKIGVSEGS